jgi:hypothetical protein
LKNSCYKVIWISNGEIIKKVDKKMNNKNFLNKKGNDAVSEILGTVLLLMIVAAVFTIIFNVFLTDEGAQPETLVTIKGRIKDGNIEFQHLGGESIGLDSVIFLSIAGQEESILVGDCLNSNLKEDGSWDISESIILVNYTNLENEEVDAPNVYATITDTYSNSFVFLANLQNGTFIGNRGGLWHFDEGTGFIVSDSLGYNTPGVVVGADWTPGVLNTGLDFNGIQDKVIVPDSNSLDFKEEITIEAWMKPTIDVLLSETELDAEFGYNPRIIPIDDTIYAVVYQGKDEGFGDGTLKTIEIDINGDINETEKDTLVFGNGVSGELEPVIININGDFYAIVYKNKDNEATLKTVKIYPNGTINDTIIDSLILDNNPKNDEPDIVHVADDIFAIVYRDKTFSKLHTVQIAPDGIINGTVDKVTFDTAWCEDPEIKHVSGDIFAIAYVKNPNQITIRTVKILSNGSIISTGPGNFYLDELLINNDFADDPNIIHISGEVYAVSYSRHTEKYGEVATFKILNDGSISNSIIDVLRFESIKCSDSNIIQHDDDIYLIAYTSTTPHIGYVIGVEIKDNGDIMDNVSSYFTYANDQGYEPNITRVNGNVYAIVFRGWSPHTGYLGTINPYHNVDPSTSGILKKDAYGIYINLTHAFGTINDQTISASISGGWNHIVLTYDGSIIKLYSNATEIASQPYSGEINRNSNSLLIGSFFMGEIDELALYDRALLPAEILSHYNDQKP